MKIYLCYPIPKSLSSGKGLTIASLKVFFYSFLRFKGASAPRHSRQRDVACNIEAAMSPDPNEVSGRYAPGGCRRRRLGVKGSRP